MAVWVDLVTDENGAPSIARVPKEATPDDHTEYMTWARQYLRYALRSSSPSLRARTETK